MHNRLIKRGMLPLIALLLLINSCNLFELPKDDTKDSIAIDGTWELTSSWGTTTLEFTNTLYRNGIYYQAEIVNYKNGSLNADSSTEGLTGYGYCTLLYSGGAGNGKYGILRWKSLTTDAGITTMSYSEGFKNATPGGYNDPIYFDTAAEAEAGMNDDFFGMYTVGMTKK